MRPAGSSVLLAFGLVSLATFTALEAKAQAPCPMLSKSGPVGGSCFRLPKGVQWFFVRACGGGGGGAGGGTGMYPAGGGGGGAAGEIRGYLVGPVSPGDQFQVVPGVGGAGGKEGVFGHPAFPGNPGGASTLANSSGTIKIEFPGGAGGGKGWGAEEDPHRAEGGAGGAGLVPGGKGGAAVFAGSRGAVEGDPGATAKPCDQKTMSGCPGAMTGASGAGGGGGGGGVSRWGGPKGGHGGNGAGGGAKAPVNNAQPGLAATLYCSGGGGGGGSTGGKFSGGKGGRGAPGRVEIQLPPLAVPIPSM